MRLVDMDTAVFNKVMEAFGLPKASADEKALREQAIQAATKDAIEVPFKVMQASYASMSVIKAMAEIGNPNSASDAGVAALCARAAVLGAFMNVKINAQGYKGQDFTRAILKQGYELEQQTVALEQEIIALVNSKII
jgi:glutamate formiminotransferase/formiminotetrahydrofolate cyclodeaminase